jgi:hypothetical protein
VIGIGISVRVGDLLVCPFRICRGHHGSWGGNFSWERETGGGPTANLAKCDLPLVMTVFGAIARFPGRLSQPVEGDPALRWTGTASETTMTTENPISSCRRAPWNKGRLIGQKCPLKSKDVWTVRVRLQLEGRRRELAMFNLAIDSKPRGCDLVRLTIDDVVGGGIVRDRATVIQKKTGRPVQFEITEQTRSAIGEWLAKLDVGRGRYLFPSRFRELACHGNASVIASARVVRQR